MNAFFGLPCRRARIKFILFCLSIVGAGEFVAPCSAATRQWLGHFSGSWSNPNNWDPVGVPQEGENLIFAGAAPPLQEIHMNNDLVNLRVRDFLFCGAGWSLDGNELTLLDDVNRDGGCGATAVSSSIAPSDSEIRCT
jgi:hypothetical protein